MSKPRVAIIGAGISGLSSLKEALADGLDAVCFDAREEIGGGWVYQADAVESSVYAGTMMNSCRDTSSFSDFPFDPARYPDYFSHRLFLRYLQEYAAFFDLARHVRLQTRVLDCAPQDDGTWVVKTKREGSSTAQTDTFSAVIVAAGHLSTPRTPDIPGRDVFQGQVLHSHVYRTPAPFEGKRVAVVGLGSSAIDIACELAPHAEALHLITRRGGWVLPRFLLGKPVEALDNRATQLWVPVAISQWLQTKLLNFVQGPPPPAMMPDHKILEQSPSMRGDFWDKAMTGLIQIQRGDVRRMNTTSITISPPPAANKMGADDDAPDTDAEEIDLDVDVVIFATGYDMFHLPYLPADTIRPPALESSSESASSESSSTGWADLYRLIHPLRYRNLFFHGYVELHGPLPPAAEAQARYTASILAGRVPPPTPDEMAKGLAAFRAWQSRNFVASPRHSATGHQIAYMDELLEAADLGAAPTFPRLLAQVFTSGHPLRALGVLNAVWFGIPNSAQWRLLGHGATPALAAETVLRTAASKTALSPGEADYLKKTL